MRCRLCYNDLHVTSETWQLAAQVVSCEMIEAVGHENLPAYFGAISSLLKPGGQAVIQVSPSRTTPPSTGPLPAPPAPLLTRFEGGSGWRFSARLKSS